LRIYLDLNCFNRPFDNQSQQRIADETVAVFHILQRVVDGSDELVWSDVLSFENNQHPLADRSQEISRWMSESAKVIAVTDDVQALAAHLHAGGAKALDAVHLACAEVAKCDYFMTCDDSLLRAGNRAGLTTRVVTPIKYVEEISNG
jgi:predicted nucleic acid-binding protein